MFLAGFGLESLVWIGAGAMACMVLLYLLRLRRRAVPVAYAPLWISILRDPKSSRWRSQLQRLLSLLVQLVLLLALTLALGDLRCADVNASARHLVILVDTSASMGATDVAPSRLGQAQNAVQQLLDGLGPVDEALVAQMDEAVLPLSPMTSQLAALRDATRQLRVSDTEADVSRAFQFALDSLRDRSRPEIVLVSDGAFASDGRLDSGLTELAGLQGVALSYVPVGRAADNLAITALSVRRYPLDRARFEVLLELTNSGEQSAEVQLALWGDGELLQTTSLTLEPHQILRKVYRQLTGVDRRVEARLTVAKGVDWLQADNAAYAVLPARRRSRVLVVGQANAYLEAALLLDEYLQVITIDDKQAIPPGQFDVTIFDGSARPRQARLGSLFYLGLPENQALAPLQARREIEQFGFDSFKASSSIFRWIEPGNIQVLEGHSLRAKPGDQVLGASDKGPILVSGTREGQQFLVLGFDPRDSDFVLRVGWPLFVLNVLHYYAESAGDYVSSLQTGELWDLPVGNAVGNAVGSADGAVDLIEPNGNVRSVVVHQGRVRLVGRHAGFHSLQSPSKSGGGDQSIEGLLFAANLGSRSESEIAPSPTLVMGERPLLALEGFNSAARQTFWGWLLVFVLGCSAVEWLSYHRRWTV